jgi:predicted RNA binding protein YcfA (HicA-like mRNA interferase family)
VECYGFRFVRQRGSHRIFKRVGSLVLNLQDVAGKAEEYQVKQVLEIIDALDVSE